MLNWEQIKNIISLFEEEKSDQHKMNYKFNFDPVDFFYEYRGSDDVFEIKCNFSISVEYQEGGEDQGSHWEVIIKFEDHILKDCAYMRYVGRYDSWNGVDLDIKDGYLVEPVKRMVEQTFWEKVNG